MFLCFMYITITIIALKRSVDESWIITCNLETRLSTSDGFFSFTSDVFNDDKIKKEK
jgi:hypothetical protein